MRVLVQPDHRRGAPTEDEFVGAVIRTHARIRFRLEALLRGETDRPRTAAVEDEEIIRAYCSRYGVEPAPDERRDTPTPHAMRLSSEV